MSLNSLGTLEPTQENIIKMLGKIQGVLSQDKNQERTKDGSATMGKLDYCPNPSTK